MTEDEIRDLLREMKETPVPADSLARVRMRLEQGVRRRAWWKMVAFAAAAVAVLLVAFLLRPNPAPSKIEPTPNDTIALAHQPEPPRAELPVPIPKAKVRPKIRRARQPESNASSLVDPLVIRIQTEDPDVVILLVGDKQN